MTNKFNDTLNKLMTSTQYQHQEEVLRDIEALGEEYLLLYNEVEFAYDYLKATYDTPALMNEPEHTMMKDFEKVLGIKKESVPNDI